MRITKKKKAIEILNILKQLYPTATCSLNYETPLQLLVATILSAQCTDERVNKVTPALFKRFPTAESFAQGDRQEIETFIHSTGFYRNKAKNIHLTCQKIVQDFNGNVPQTMKELLTLAGVARKTANVVLAHAFGIIEGVTVDTHVKRLSNRLGLTTRSNPVLIEQDLMKLLPQPEWENFSISIIYHGRAVCNARKPNCTECALNHLCKHNGSK
ncbi:endonuclease III [Geminocystis sp. NIES-3709]|uniref:endonuclease III n=1 Tax=Geminocystis sp. NIES-3709 TaxID=1617448 RepID=UPI0005FCA9F2|nr:endonuclease III [Geminocystis sp. NIES-3709]BAQ65129.1 endonuclease III [Geminocystis sp. NIES-3709]